MNLKTRCGEVAGNEREHSVEYLGIPFATAKRFEYAVPTKSWDGVLDATKPGSAMMQKRAWPRFEHLEIPERAFYHHEFREGIKFSYGEENLNLNIYAPKDGENHPVIVFIHGGGFDSGSINESSFDGDALAKRGLVVVFITYRVGIFGYLTNNDLLKKNGREGNYGLDDQLVGIKWVKENIADYGGDPNNITLMGQSAGAMSIQYLCLSKKNEGLFKRAIMMSGAGLFPKFSLPRPHDQTNEYWNAFMKIAGCNSIDELKLLPAEKVFDALEVFKASRKDNTYNTMPVIDGVLIEKPIDEAIKEPLPIDYMIGITNADMFAPILASIGMKFAKANNGYAYYFDIDAKGDKNHAFHSSDLRYMFGTLDKSWRPYDEYDHEISEMMMDYVADFAATGNPNGGSLPRWDVCKGKALAFGKKIKMRRPNMFKLAVHMLGGDPK